MPGSPGDDLAQHRYLSRQLHNRGDRLAFSNGIVALAVVAGLLLWGRELLAAERARGRFASIA